MTITKQVLNRLKCEYVLVPFLVAHAHWYKGPDIKREQWTVYNVLYIPPRVFILLDKGRIMRIDNPME